MQLIQKWISFLCLQKSIRKKGCECMVNIIREELPMEEVLRKKANLICEFAKVKTTIINGSIRKIEKD